MRNVRFLLATILASVVLVPLGAQNLAEDVLRGTPFGDIEFRNYEGPHRIIESRAAIQGIGADLGRQMAASGVANYAGKYRVQRIHDPASDKLSADLFILEAGAGVDHIRNLNWIVSSYLQGAFGYSVEDADLLANFVTRYNGYYRGKVDYVGQAFIPPVGSAVTAETVGLSLLWSDWPGKTRMLIPLRDSLSKGLGGSVNTEEISNQAIVTQMAQDPGRGIEERKALADLKEAEIVQEQKAVAQAEARASAPPGTSAVGPTTTSPQNPVATPTVTPSTPASTPAAVETTAPPKAAEPAKTLPLEEAKKDLAARDAALQAERQDIVRQETTSPPVPAAPVKPAVTVALVHMNEASKSGQVWLVDPSANKVWKKSPLNTVRQNQAPAFGPGLLVVAGDEKAPTGAVRLVLVSKDDGSVLVTGSDDVSPTTPLVFRGNLVLALVKDAKVGWVLGAFDPNLKLVTRGTDGLSPLTAVVPTSGGLLVQGASGTPLLVEESTLKKKSDTEG